MKVIMNNKLNKRSLGVTAHPNDWGGSTLRNRGAFCF
jgi:hypothetical protein